MDDEQYAERVANIINRITRERDEARGDRQKLLIALRKLSRSIPSGSRGGNYGGATCGVCGGYLNEWGNTGDRHRDDCALVEAKELINGILFKLEE